MKSIIFPLLTGILALLSCTRQNPPENAQVGGAQSVPELTGTEYYLQGTSNVVKWKCRKTAGVHSGTVRIKEGKISVTDMEITAGHFVFDMDSIRITDVDDRTMYNRFVNELKSVNFFDVIIYPSATFEIVSVVPVMPEFREGEILTNFEVSGNLTIKSVTKNITFPARIDIDGSIATVATNPFIIDRTEWGLIYRSGSLFNDLREQLVDDDIILDLRLRFNKTDLSQSR